jgi:hypothetical protein
LFKLQPIQKIAAVAMLIVFAISITPAIVFHNWLARHTDTFRKNENSHGPQWGKQTFNCECGHIVAESPFTGPDKAIISYPSQSHTSLKVDLHIHPLSELPLLYSLRGPPAV